MNDTTPVPVSLIPHELQFKSLGVIAVILKVYSYLSYTHGWCFQLSEGRTDQPTPAAPQSQLATDVTGLRENQRKACEVADPQRVNNDRSLCRTEGP